MRHQRSLLIMTIVGLVVLSGCVGSIGTGDSDETDDLEGELEVHHIDVGQADSTLVVTPADETILIDTGDWRQDGQDVIDYLESEDIDRVDYLVATHAHADHIGGHAAVIEHFEENKSGVGAAYDSGVAHVSATYDEYLDAVVEYDVQLFEVAAGHTMGLDGESMEATVLNPPEGDSGADLHENSVTLRIDFTEFSYLTTGDAEHAAEAELVDNNGETLAADAYQAGHHGSSTSSTAPFLDAVDPDIAVVSSELDSQYGHPHDVILESFAERDIETYWTGIHGDIVLTTDGEEVSVTPADEKSTDPETILEKKHEARAESDAIQPSLSGPATPSGPTVDSPAAPLSTP